jgi:hypothetical protein
MSNSVDVAEEVRPAISDRDSLSESVGVMDALSNIFETAKKSGIGNRRYGR